MEARQRCLTSWRWTKLPDLTRPYVPKGQGGSFSLGDGMGDILSGVSAAVCLKRRFGT